MKASCVLWPVRADVLINAHCHSFARSYPYASRPRLSTELVLMRVLRFSTINSSSQPSINILSSCLAAPFSLDSSSSPYWAGRSRRGCVTFGEVLELLFSLLLPDPDWEFSTPPLDRCDFDRSSFVATISIGAPTRALSRKSWIHCLRFSKVYSSVQS